MGKPKLAAKTTTYAVPADTDQAWTTITCCSATYSAEIDTLRAKFASRSGAVWVRITPVINGTLLKLCLDGKNLYLNGDLRQRGQVASFRRCGGRDSRGIEPGLGRGALFQVAAERCKKTPSSTRLFLIYK